MIKNIDDGVSIQKDKGNKISQLVKAVLPAQER